MSYYQDMNEENSTPEKKEEDANITKSKTAEPFDIPLRKTGDYFQ